MATIKLNFASQLSCGECEDVLLWLHNPYKLAVNAGVTDTSLLQEFLPASIKDIQELSTTNYEYTVQYNESLLLTPANLLTECDIRQVCCAGCIAAYVDNQVAASSSTIVDNTILEVDPENSFTHTGGGGNETTVNFGHELSSQTVGGTTTLILTTPSGAEFTVDLTAATNEAAAFQCERDFPLFLDCLETLQDGLGCTYDVDPLNGRFRDYPLTLTRIETTDGDVAINISGNSLMDLITNLNLQSAVTGYNFASNGNRLRIINAPAAISRVEFTDGTDLDWRPAEVLVGSCTGTVPEWERFCAAVNRCVVYEIYRNPANPEELILEGGNGIASTTEFGSVQEGTVRQWNRAVAGTFANNGDAILALTGDFGAGTFGQLALMDVGGVPTWFKSDGTTWLFAF